MKRYLLVLVIFLVCLRILAACSPGPTFDEQYELGQRYLSEGNYKEAILAFTAAIKIDPKRAEAYVGRGDSYVEIATTLDSTEEPIKENFTAALDDYLFAIKLNNLLADVYHKLSDIYLFFDNIEAAIRILEQGFSITQNVELEGRINQLRRQFTRSALLEELYALFEVGSIDEALDLVNKTEDFANLCADVQLSFPQIYQPNPGKGVGIYKARESNFGEYYVYYGDYDGEIRKGHGLWCIVNNNEYYIFNGVWDADAPNGKGEVKEWYDRLREGVSYRRKAGMLINGLWEGDMLWEFISPEEIHSFPVHFSNGFCTILEIKEPDEYNDEFRYVMSNTGTTPDQDGYAIMSSTRDIREDVYGIAGFEDYEK